MIWTNGIAAIFRSFNNTCLIREEQLFFKSLFCFSHTLVRFILDYFKINLPCVFERARRKLKMFILYLEVFILYP
jgi:hypothetical protein